MPGVEAGTPVLIIARIDSLVALTSPEDLPSTSLCRGSHSSPAVVPTEFPILLASAATEEDAWRQLAGTALSRSSGTLPLHVWGFGGRATL
jgi:hypothetical protein